MKTDADIAAENEAYRLNAALLRAGIRRVHIDGGGRKGPFSLTVDRLDHERLQAVLEAVRPIVAAEPARA